MEIIVAWQRWQNQQWMSFSREISEIIERAFTESSVANVTIPILIENIHSNIDINFNTMQDNHGAFIQRICNKIEPDVRWEYQSGRYWMDYNVHFCEQIQISKETGRNNTTIYLCSSNNIHQFRIDILNKTQMNLQTGKMRMIRYIQGAAPKGIQREQIITDVLNNMEKMNISNIETCCICLDEFDFHSINLAAYRLPLCNSHYFHQHCIQRQLQHKGKCAVCSYMYIITEGNQPKDGEMHVNVYESGQIPLAGYENVGTIIIEYNFPSGIQTTEHPYPGYPYYGTYRVAYLPDIPEGHEILALLKRCFDLRHTFTVGRSLTTGRDHSIVWNGIHHKTSPRGGTACFGWPDSTYFMRVKEELKARGIE